MRIYVYSNESGEQVAHYDGADNNECEALADAHWSSNDYHWSYSDVPISDAVEN